MRHVSQRRGKISRQQNSKGNLKNVRSVASMEKTNVRGHEGGNKLQPWRNCKGKEGREEKEQAEACKETPLKENLWTMLNPRSSREVARIFIHKFTVDEGKFALSPVFPFPHFALPSDVAFRA